MIDKIVWFLFVTLLYVTSKGAALQCYQSTISEISNLTKPTKIVECNPVNGARIPFCAKRRYSYSYNAYIEFKGKEYFIGPQSFLYEASSCSMNNTVRNDTCYKATCTDAYTFFYALIIQSFTKQVSMIKDLKFGDCQAACCDTDLCDLDIGSIDNTSSTETLRTRPLQIILITFIILMMLLSNR